MERATLLLVKTFERATLLLVGTFASEVGARVEAVTVAVKAGEGRVAAAVVVARAAAATAAATAAAATAVPEARTLAIRVCSRCCLNSIGSSPGPR